MRFSMLAAAMTMAATPLAAKEAAIPDFGPGGQFGKAAFECASLAAIAEGPLARQAGRLAEKGHLEAQRGTQELQARIAQQGEAVFGPLTSFVESRSADFWAGIAFTQAADRIEALLDSRTSSVADDDGRQERRATEAAAEFARRDCQDL